MTLTVVVSGRAALAAGRSPARACRIMSGGRPRRHVLVRASRDGRGSARDDRAGIRGGPLFVAVGTSGAGVVPSWADTDPLVRRSCARGVRVGRRARAYLAFARWRMLVTFSAIPLCSSCSELADRTTRYWPAFVRTPGTYHHSLLVANLAERRPSSLVPTPGRARRLHHTSAKMRNPSAFIENQTAPTDDDSIHSSRGIVRHTSRTVSRSRA